MGAPQARKSVRIVKLLPPVVPPDIIRRPRLLARLDRIGGLPAALVIAGPGFGKSTLLAQWARSARSQCAWISLDPGDDDPVIFTALVAVAVERVVPGSMSGVAALLQRSAPDPRMLGEAIADAMATLAKSIVVILDDYHAIGVESPVNALLDAALGQPAPNAHFVIAARWRPAVAALDALERRGLLESFDERDLRLSDADALRLLRAAAPGSDVAGAHAGTLARLDGWPAGIRLAWLAIKQGREAPGGPIDLDLSGLLSSFSQEELEALEPLAIVEEVSPSLAAALSGCGEHDLRKVLDGLARRRQFVTDIDAAGEWRRLHHLLRDGLLRRLMASTGEAGVIRLHERASGWFEDHGDVSTAIRHAVLAGDLVRAASLIERHAYEVADRATWESVRVWLRQLPEGFAASRPGLLLLEANLLGEDGLITPMQETAARASALLDGWPDPEEAASFRLEFDGLACFAAFVFGKFETERPRAERVIADARSSATARSSALSLLSMVRHVGGDSAGALHLLEEAERRGDEPDVLRAGALAGKIWLAMLAGAPAAAEAIAQRALHRLAPGAGYMIPWTSCLAGLLAYERGDLAAARAPLERADRLGRQAGPWSECASAAGHVLLLRASGETEAARTRAQEFWSTLALRGDTPWLEAAAALEAQLDLLDGRTGAVERLLAMPRGPWNRGMALACNPVLVRGLALLARGEPGDAEAALGLLQWHREDLEASRNRWWLGRAQAAEAMALDAVGQRGAALALLAEPLAEAREGLARRYADLGTGFAPLLRAATESGDPGLARDAGTVLALMNPVPRRPAPVPLPAGFAAARDLTRRERQVLALLRERATNREIAESLGVSDGTSKKHVANLLRKLGVSSRRAAAELAGDAPLAPGS